MATYTDTNHLLIVLRMKGESGFWLQNESWQVGWRAAVSADDPLSKTAGRVELPVFGVDDAYVTRQTTSWNIAQGFSGSSTLGGNVTDADCDTIADSVLTWLTAHKTKLSTYYVLDSIRLYPVRPDGKSATAPTIYTPRVTTGDPTGTSAMPPDTAVVVSTQTPTRGPKGRGRFYVGGLATACMNAEGQVDATQRALFLSTTKAMFDGWRGMSGGLGDAAYSPIVWHRTGDKAGIEEGKHGSAIRSIRIDQRFDTQMRRDRQNLSSWTESQLA